MKLLLIFILLNIVNVIIGTFKSIATIKGTKLSASIWNALSYGVNTIVVIYMTCELQLYIKALVVALCNFIGVLIVRTLQEKAEKDKLWKVELYGNKVDIKKISDTLNSTDIKFSITNTNDSNYQYINIYCYTKQQSAKIKNIAEFYNLKYFVSEGKVL